MVSKEDKKVFASIQHSRATILKLMDVKGKRRMEWLTKFFEEVTKKPQEIKDKLKDFEDAVARVSDTLSLGRNTLFTSAISVLRLEILSSNSDTFNEKYYNAVLNQVLSIVQEVYAVALHAFETNQELQEQVNTRYLAKAAQILEEARLTEYMEDEDYE